MKSHRSAVVVIPPAAVLEPIQAIRRRYDRNLGRWMPHVTLLYPFLSETAAHADRAARACATVAPFAVTLEDVRSFGHGSAGYTLWLAPEPAAPMRALAGRLREEFPECDDTFRHAGGFTPHLSVGQARGARELEARLSDIRAGWEAVTFTVEAVALIAREAVGPFRVVQEVKLGGGAR